MKKSKKISLVVIALTLLAGLVWLVSRPDEPAAPRVTDTSRGPSFEVRVVKPRLARPLFGVFPTSVEEKLFGVSELRFDHASRGAEVGGVGRDRVELRAEGWDLLIEADGEGRITPATRLVFQMELAERQRRLRCRPAERPTGYFDAATREGSDVLDGSFLVELATCENAETGKVIQWPPAPLTVRGSFGGLAGGRP